MEKTQVLQLKVAQAVQQDVGKGLIRIGTKHGQALHIGRGDLVELQGARPTAAIPVPGYAEDEGLDIVRLDGLVRGNAGVGLGDPVKVKKAVWKEAKKVTLAPAKAGFRIAGSGEGLKPTLLFRPLVQGDLVSTTVFNRPQETFPSELFSEEFFRGFFESPAFGLMEIRLVVTATVPAGIVRVTEGTQIQLASEYQEVTDRQFHHVTYDDLGGMKEAVQKVREMIELPLKHPELFDRLGIDAPKGVLLHGPPGTGKTLMVKAVAQEAQAYFTAINGPEIMGKMYGESEQRLREIFDEAEKNAPAIVFIDELDSIAPKRAEVTGEVERRIVAQLLTLMDGLKSRRHVIVIGATNMVEAIDPALRRPWRFDREIVVEMPTVRWENIGGLKEVRQTLHEMVEIPLKKPETFRRLGIRPPKGLLLHGAPGTGKTLVAKAVANQAGANFLVAKGSSLLSKWYGESEKKIAEFFRRARQVAPAVLFFDELDSLAPIRGRALGEPQVTERVVNQLLAEMDGLEELQGVFVLGATNRLDMIEPALLRPGRFDQVVYVPIPDQEARLEILRAHTKGMALDPSISIQRLADLAVRFTGADIAGVCLKAGLYALRENLSAQTVTVEHFLRAIKDTIPSVTEEAEQEYQKLAQTFEQDSHRIGFRK